MVSKIAIQTGKFIKLLEVVPPAGPDATPLLNDLAVMADLPIQGFSVATNPVAKPRMSAMALCALIQERTGLPTCLHCTTRDHNRLSLQGLLWGAQALGVTTVLITTGDFIALSDRGTTSSVRDLDVFDLVAMACETGLQVGVVLDPHPEIDGMTHAVERLARKADAGAAFAVTQPVYDTDQVEALAAAVDAIDIPIIMGILPLRTPRHAEFLHHKVAGIAVPKAIRDRMRLAAEPIGEGIANARDMLALARQHFAGACLMPPFDHFEVMGEILEETAPE